MFLNLQEQRQKCSSQSLVDERGERSQADKQLILTLLIHFQNN